MYKTSFNAITLIFIFILTALFYYIYTIDNSNANYTSNDDKIVILKLLDKDLDNFLLHNANFTNYDDINRKYETFEHILHELKNDLSTDMMHKGMRDTFATIIQNFQNKREDIEHFKSLNASLLNNVHFLYDLQASIADEPMISEEIINDINKILFFILQYSTSSYIDKSSILKYLDSLNIHANKSSSELLDTFYQQAKLMLCTLSSLKKISATIHTHQLYASLQELHTSLHSIYEQNLHIQKSIALFFFVSAILILISLLIMQYYAHKRQKELQAFKYAMQHSDNTVVITDPDRHITFVNEAFEKSSGYSATEAMGENPSILKSGEQEASYYEAMNEKLDDGEKWEGQFINKRKDGSLYYEKASIVPVFLNDKLINYLAIKLDITEFVEQNLKLAQAATVFDNTEEAIVISNAHNDIISVNRAFMSMYGYEEDEIMGKKLTFLHSGKQGKLFYQKMWAQINSEDQWRGKLINVTKTGEQIPVWMSIKVIRDKKGAINSYTAVQTDLRELESSQARVEFLAYHDDLTGLSNRINFEDHLNHAIKVATRIKEQLALFFIDLDRFKVINDTLGHDVGDTLLTTIASRLQSTLRESDLISRWGGDEFAVILEEFGKQSDLALVANNILDQLKLPIQIDDHLLNITASIGIAIFPEDGKNSNTLMKHADSAMYLAKDSGKNNFQYYTDELSKKSKKKLDIDMAMQDALTNGEFYLHFQPQYDLSTKIIKGVEALIRWNNPKLGFIPPNEFIPIAEDTGRIISIGYFVFEEACKAFSKMKAKIQTLDTLSVNVSSIQFREEHLFDTFVAIANRYQIPSYQIEIEITERFIMEQTDKNVTLLHNFRNHGFLISIDDFGTGYSSMSYLKKLPIDIIKIDKSFIDDITDDHADFEVTQAIIALSKKLNYKIIAEGIELQVQEDILNNEGCDLGQGYLFSRPVNYEEIIKNYS